MGSSPDTQSSGSFCVFDFGFVMARQRELFAICSWQLRASATFIYPCCHGTFAIRRTFRQQGLLNTGNRLMAKESHAASEDVKNAMHRRKKGTLKSERSGKKVTSKKQAVAIGLSEARREGKKVPARKKAS
jgi:hypothetical protein